MYHAAVKRAMVAALMAAGCAPEPPPPPPPFEIGASFVPLAELKELDLPDLTEVMWTRPTERTHAFELKQDKVRVGRIELEVAFNAEEALDLHRQRRAALERERPDPETTYLVRDRAAPGPEAFVVSQDAPGKERGQRQRLAMIGFVWGKYVVGVTVHGEASFTLDSLERRAGRIAGWLKERFDRYAKPSA